jgi:hypothetical protein
LSTIVRGAISTVLWHSRQAGRRLALAEELAAGGPVAELIDQIRLPVDRAVARVGGVQHRFLVRVLRIRLSHKVEDFGCGKRRHRLRQERVLHLRVEQRLDLRVRVSTHCERVGHQQPGVLGDFLARVALQHVACDVPAGGDPQQEQQQERQVELEQQLHGVASWPPGFNVPAGRPAVPWRAPLQVQTD